MQKKCILVVDDDTLNLMRTQKILEQSYDVLLAESGKEALALLPRHKVDLVLLDISMPKMDGIETFERIKALPVKDFPAKLPVIFLTASGDADDVMRAIELGAVNYLKKPFFPEELLKRVTKELDEQ